MKPASRPRVLLADDHRMVAEGLKRVLLEEFDLVGVVEDGQALLEAARRLRPDVVVADISMPILNGLDALVLLKESNPRIHVVMLTMHHDAAYARRALEAGASGFVLKHSASAELVMAVRAALAGETFIAPALAAELLRARENGPPDAADPATHLTLRQREILQLMTAGHTTKEMAEALQVSPRTVEFHKYRLMEILNLRTSADLIRFAVQHGLSER